MSEIISAVSIMTTVGAKELGN